MKDKLIQIRVNEQQKKVIKEKADKLGMSITVFMVQLALGNLKNEEVK